MFCVLLCFYVWRYTTCWWIKIYVFAEVKLNIYTISCIEIKRVIQCTQTHNPKHVCAYAAIQNWLWPRVFSSHAFMPSTEYMPDHKALMRCDLTWPVKCTARHACLPCTRWTILLYSGKSCIITGYFSPGALFCGLLLPASDSHSTYVP